MRPARVAAPSLAPSRHPGELVEAILGEFCTRFTPGGRVLHVGVTAQGGGAYIDRESLAALRVTLEVEDGLPDVIVHHVDRSWLVLVSAEPGQGVVSAARRAALVEQFASCTAGLVFVTAFADQRVMASHLAEVAWETEVWVAGAPSHMIHFNGERFLGPY